MSTTLLAITLAVALFFAACSFGKLPFKAEVCYRLHWLLLLPFYGVDIPPEYVYQADGKPTALARLAKWLSDRWCPAYFEECRKTMWRNRDDRW